MIETCKCQRRGEFRWNVRWLQNSSSSSSFYLCDKKSVCNAIICHCHVVVDYRKPLFRRGIMSFGDTSVGQQLTGSITNVTHFGAFVDVGVGHDGLIHTSDISARLLPPTRPSLQIGDHVMVSIKSVDVVRHRLGLSLVQLIIS